jgi:hypothetical protein
MKTRESTNARQERKAQKHALNAMYGYLKGGVSSPTHLYRRHQYSRPWRRFNGLASTTTAPPEPMFLGLQLLDEVDTRLVEVRVNEIQIDAHTYAHVQAEAHANTQTLLEFDAVFAVSAAAAGCRSGRAALACCAGGSLVGLTARRVRGARGTRSGDGRDGWREVGAGREHVVVVGGGRGRESGGYVSRRNRRSSVVFLSRRLLG